MSDDIFSQLFNLFNNDDGDVNWNLASQINNHINKESEENLLFSNSEMNYVEIFRALGVLILIYLFGFADETLLPSIIMTLHALINLIVSFGILFSYQRRLLIKPINN